jgi:uncharacterized protein
MVLAWWESSGVRTIVYVFTPTTPQDPDIKLAIANFLVKKYGSPLISRSILGRGVGNFGFWTLRLRSVQVLDFGFWIQLPLIPHPSSLEVCVEKVVEVRESKEGKYQCKSSMKIAIAGATGFVGSRLVEQLQTQGYQVMILTRNPQQASSRFPQAEVVGYNPFKSGEWQKSISGCDAVVNLAGEAIAEKRWTAAQKQLILESRQLTTEKIVEAIDRAEVKPQVLVNASAIGYYGTSETAKFDETSPAGADFLAQVCSTWETTAATVIASGTRSVILRLGIVLGEKGGALGKMLAPFSAFVGGPIGSGKQWFSWIHRDDVVKLIVTAIENPQMEGVYNATAPNPATMSEFTQTLGAVMSRPSWLPVPDFALEALLGEGAIVVLQGQQVLPTRTLAQGFTFDYPTLKPALTEILKG